MGLASKLQAAQQVAGAVGGAALMGAPAGAPPRPGSYSGPVPGAPGGPPPSAPPAPYGSPYPPPQQQPGMPPPYGAPPQPGGPAPSPYPPGAPMPSPYPPGAPVPQQQQQQQARPPYPPQAGGMPGAYQQQQAPPPAFPGGAGMLPPQQQPQASPYPAPGMPGGAPMAAAPSAAHASAPIVGAGGMVAAIHTKLAQVVAANQLQRFYSQQAVADIAQRLDARVNFRDLAARWRMPVELALDLSSLALYDVILFADDSGSMAFEEGGERIDDLKLIGGKVSEVATLFDDDGILMRFMNSPTEGNGLRSPADVAGLLASVSYSGLTPLAASLNAKVLAPIVYSLAGRGALAKPVLVITITDGEPTDTPRDAVVQVIKEARARLAAQGFGPKAVAFEFAQVGKDARAQAFLETLDKHPEVGPSIDCTSYFELESAEYARKGITLSPEAWLVKMMVGAIDPSYDEGDE